MINNHTSQLSDQVPGTTKNYLSITPNQGVMFPSVSYVRNLVSKAGIKQVGSTRVI